MVEIPAYVLNLFGAFLLVWAAATGWGIRFLINKALKGMALQLDGLGQQIQERHEAIETNRKGLEEVWHQFQEFKVHVAREYVGREDWIRFASKIDAKIDGLAGRLDTLMEKLYAKHI